MQQRYVLSSISGGAVVTDTHTGESVVFNGGLYDAHWDAIAYLMQMNQWHEKQQRQLAK